MSHVRPVHPQPKTMARTPFREWKKKPLERAKMAGVKVSNKNLRKLHDAFREHAARMYGGGIEVLMWATYEDSVSKMFDEPPNPLFSRAAKWKP